MRRWLGFGEDEWDGLSWDRQQAYLDGLSAEEDIPFQVQQDAGEAWQPGQEAAPGMAGPAVRQAAGGGADVIDLRKMISELEADPQARRRT